MPRSPTQSYREWQSVISEQWNKLDEAQKKKYNELANSEFVKYRQELAKWELKMVRLGNIDLVRDEALIEHDKISKPRFRRTKPVSSDSDWDLGWYSSSQSSNDINNNKLDSKKNTFISTQSPLNSINSPTFKTHQEYQNPLPVDDDDATNKKDSKVGIKLKSSDGEKDNTTSEKQNSSREYQKTVPEKDEKSKKVIDKLKDLFKF